MTKPRQYTPDEDAQLLERVQQGDVASFEVLLRKYVKRMFNLVHLLCGNARVAADCCRKAFVAAWMEARSLRSTMHFSSWLVVLLLREYRLQLEFGEVMADGGGAANEPATERGLRESIRALPPDLCLLLVLYHVRGYRLEKVAEILQIREDVILDRLFLAQGELLHLLKRASAEGEERREFGLSSSHLEARRKFPAYLESSVEEKEKELIRRHLGECGSCREALAELEWIAEHLKGLPDLDPPLALLPGIMSEVGTKVPLPPRPIQPPTVYGLFSRGRKRVVLLLVIAVTIYWYLAPHRETEVREEAPLPAERKGAPLPPAAERGEEGKSPSLPTMQMRSEYRPGTPYTPTQPPPVPEKSYQPPPPAPQTEPLPPPAARQSKQPKQPAFPAPATLPKPKVEATPALPPDWGEGGGTRPAQRKAVPLRGRGGETSVLLGVSSSEGADVEIERAVTSLGGSVTGRGYSGGRDILYVRIDVESVMELMGKLGKIGAIQELPAIPDGVSGQIDMVIKW